MKKTQRAFTLVELIIVIAVIGVLAAILIPVFADVIDKANAKSALSDARNTISQVHISAAEHTDMPENIVIFVRKAGNMYVYGYNRALGGAIQISDGNPYRGYADISALSARYGWSGAAEPDINAEYTFGTNNAFYLVSPSDAASTGFRGIYLRSADYVDVSAQFLQDADMGADVTVCRGILLPGTFSLDESKGKSAETEDADDGRFTLTFDADGGNLSLPSGFTNGASFAPDTDITDIVTGAFASRGSAAFKGWHLMSSDGTYTEAFYMVAHADTITITRNYVLKAAYDEIYNITFRAGEGATGDDIIVPDQHMGNIIEIPAPVGMSKDGYTFRCWKHSSGAEVDKWTEWSVTGYDVFTAQWELAEP